MPQDSTPVGSPQHRGERAFLRADAAATSLRRFMTPLCWLPGTLLARTERPWKNVADPVWNYWWQAQVLDAMIDAGLRHAVAGHRAEAMRWLADGRRLLRGVILRNGLRVGNRFYDDMAWLALATMRLDDLAARVHRPGSCLARFAQREWGRRFQTALTNPWGGTWWNTEHDFANAPAAGPIALWFARRGDHATAERLADWLAADLRDPETGLVFDGMREINGERVIEQNLYTYNQGTAIGLGLALGGRHLARVDELIDGVAAHLTVAPDVVRTEGGGDGGLFGGILARYLAQAAIDARIDPESRAQAARLVTATAEALWQGRSGTKVFPSSPLRPVDPQTDTARVPLPEQVQAWTILEAASVVERSSLA